jgi:hypothetical protein
MALEGADFLCMEERKDGSAHVLSRDGFSVLEHSRTT